MKPELFGLALFGLLWLKSVLQVLRWLAVAGLWTAGLVFCIGKLGGYF